MLSLFCGAASHTERSRLLSVDATDGLLVVVPDEVKARALVREQAKIDLGAKSMMQVVDLPEFLTRILPKGRWKSWVPSNIVRTAIRAIIESNATSYEYLVGNKSVPRLTEGVLTRIVSGVDALANRDAASEDSVFISNREKQLRTLAGELEARLIKLRFSQEKFGVLQALTELTDSAWNKCYQGCGNVVFTDFDKWNDTGYMAVSALTRLAANVSVLLDYDPEVELESVSPLDPAYQRFYEMADTLILDDVTSAPDKESLFPSEMNKSVVVNAKSTSEEVMAAALLIKSFFSHGETERPTSVTVALPNWDGYVTALEQALENCGGSVGWYRRYQSLRSSQWRLLERLRDAGKTTVKAGDIASLWRTVGFAQLTGDQISQVECWNLAARLDYIVTLSGQVVGWPRITRRFNAVLRQVQADRQRKGQLSTVELGLDEELLKTLEITRGIAANFKAKSSVKQWSKQVIEILQKTLPHESGDNSNALTSEMIGTTLDVSRFSELISTKPIRFSEFISLYRTALYTVSINNGERFEEAAVKVCPPKIAASLKSDVCFVLGCNDGHFPSFTWPEASFTEQSFRDNQSRNRAEQKQLLHQLAHRHLRLLLWMPEREGIENLLPSQFLEELLENGAATQTSAQDLMVTMGLNLQQTELPNPKSQMAQSLTGITLSESELGRFLRRDRVAHNLALTTSIMASRANPVLSCYDGIITDPQLKQWLSSWAKRHIYSVSQLDTVVGCSFRFFGERILNLQEIEESDDLLAASTFGSIVHDVLARFYRQWVFDGRLIPTPDEEMLAREKLGQAFEFQLPDVSGISEFATDLLVMKMFGDFTVESFIEGPETLANIRNPGLLGQFLLLEMERSANMTASSFRPSNFEVGFGQGKMDEDDPLTNPDAVDLDLGNGEAIRLRGRIDRIDVSDEGVFAVTDYKTGSTPPKKQISEGYKTQLPIYTLIAEQLLTPKFSLPEGAGGMYYPLKPQSNAKVGGSFLKKAYQAPLGVSGRSCLSDEDYEIVLEKVRGYMRQSLRSVRDGNLTTTWRDETVVCPYCPFESFCYRDVDRTRAYWVERGLDEAIADV